MQPNNKRWWGPPGPIGPYSVVEFSLRTNNVQKLLNNAKKQGIQASQRTQRLIDDCVQATLDGIHAGFLRFDKTSMRQVPMNTGALREALVASLYKSVPHTQVGLPATVQIGVSDPNIKYAPIVNRFKPAYIQIRHTHGLQMSGKPIPHYLYYVNASSGDLQAQYSFFHFIIENLKTILLGPTRRLSKGTIVDAAVAAGLGRSIYRYIIKWRIFAGGIP
jgi:hypothetical protein